ncbi:adenosylcobinamide amidohydrolase [Nonomuraea sp. NPDC026600]|uniref:adenosylcobinamide amidohydrolase n=1 Tax=Nonomuraea sp. NPDC026600 TaxID=3155363 RepID=UPI00340A1407
MKLAYRVEDGVRLGSLLWEFGPGWRMVSSALLGGGIGARTWVLNAQVVAGYSRMDPVDHLRELGPDGLGVGMMTAASVERYARAVDGEVEVVATVGLRVPTWAAAPEGATDPELAPMLAEPAAADPGPTPMPIETAATRPPVGTINLMAVMPVAMTDAALVNAVMTMTEAKSQALIEAGFPCTGTASDALCLAVRADGPEELFGGPRSTWGARLARAVHSAVHQGAASWHPRT